MPQVASAADYSATAALAAPGSEDRAESRGLIRDLVRDIFRGPFRSLTSRSLPAQVVGLARECDDALPRVSERYPILADALDDRRKEPAAEHGRRGARQGLSCPQRDRRPQVSPPEGRGFCLTGEKAEGGMVIPLTRGGGPYQLTFR
jgi:hypothetical protein